MQSLPNAQLVAPNLGGTLANNSLVSLFMSHHISIQRQPVSNKIYAPMEGGST